jgi:hypothetical protein
MRSNSISVLEDGPRSQSRVTYFLRDWSVGAGMSDER